MTTAKVLVINGSYRDDGITDQAIEVALEAFAAAGADSEVINLRNYPIEFCLNCRECTQQRGSDPGHCVIDDDMHELVDKIESARAYVLASPTNFSSVTAIFKRFMERLVAYSYWPWDKPYPIFRKHGLQKKKAMLISSSAAPSWMGRWLFGSARQLETTAKVIGAKSVGTLFTGLASSQKHQPLSAQSIERARTLANRLVAG